MKNDKAMKFPCCNPKSLQYSLHTIPNNHKITNCLTHKVYSPRESGLARAPRCSVPSSSDHPCTGRFVSRWPSYCWVVGDAHPACGSGRLGREGSECLAAPQWVWQLSAWHGCQTDVKPRLPVLTPSLAHWPRRFAVYGLHFEVDHPVKLITKFSWIQQKF